ncbi:MucR family transcriptional regulator [Neoaquamicrobium sediminum]|uniref:MucR family transcriptional regulator n=1 Tax=Neoaquamicrobium sediminum TaxID=1849104 RepID=A0ABV3X0Q5_9HYPH
MNEQGERDQLVALTADIVSAYVSKNPLPMRELADLIESVHISLAGLTSGAVQETVAPLKPAVPVKKSVHDDYIICLEDGKKFKSLKRHLSVHFGLTPAEYRDKWGLPHDYPMVAPGYSAARSALAKSMGLGRKPSAPAPKKRSRKKAAASA